MPGWSEQVERFPPLDFVDYSLRSVGQVVFMNNPITGLAILVAVWVYSPWVGFAGTLGTVVANLVPFLLGLDRSLLRAGLHGYNGVLVGTGLATFLTPHWSGAVIGWIICVTIFSNVLLVALGKVFLGSWQVPPFTLPFNFATLLFLVAALNFKHGHVGTAIAPHGPAVLGSAVKTGLLATPTSASVVTVGSVLNAIFRGIGQLFFADKLASGVIIIVGILVCSRIAGIFALVGSIFGMLTGLLLGANGYSIYHGLWGFNSFDACLAIAGVFFVLTWKSGLLGIACAIATALLFGSIGAFFEPWGLPALTLPFCFGTLAFALMRGVATQFTPVAVEDIVTPEEHLVRDHQRTHQAPPEPAASPAY